MAVGRTVLYTLGSLALQVPLGVALAVFFNRDFLGKGFVRTLFLLPFVATPAAIALIWVLIYNPATGVLNYVLELARLPRGQWTYGADSALWALVVVDTWQHTPLVMLIALAGLAALPPDPYESAQIDGASPPRRASGSSPCRSLGPRSRWRPCFGPSTPSRRLDREKRAAP